MTTIEQQKEQFFNNTILMLFSSDGKCSGESEESIFKKGIEKYHTDPLFHLQVKTINHFANDHAAKMLLACQEKLTGYLLTDAQMIRRAISEIEK